MNSCSKSGSLFGDCGSCDGGQPSCAFEYWLNTGVVTEACYPYSLPSCDHHISDSSNPCPESYEYDTPACQDACTVDGQSWVKYQASEVHEVHLEKSTLLCV